MALLPALRFETDGFRAPEGRIMGRHSAGRSFLKAFVEASGGAPVTGVGARRQTGVAFAEDVRALDSRAVAQWRLLDNQQGIAACGGMHLPDPSLAVHANLRQSLRPDAYCLTGITHTISSVGAMGLIADMVVAPVMPWDGLICTSDAVLQSVKALMGAQAEYLRWRFGAGILLPAPQLATIPLGIECDHFSGLSGESGHARAALGIEPDEIVFLFLGRLSFHAKAHPMPMYLGLEEAACATGKRIVLVQCGWFANEHIEHAFRDGAERFAPSVRHIFLDGREEPVRQKAWSACDIFISLSDNIQETFGLTIIEAMAAGKPVIATDWDGYRQTLRHGESGFLIPTFMPDLESDARLALSHAAGTVSYDQYLAVMSTHVSVDLRALHEAMVSLVQSAELRAAMGAQGRARARAVFDWPVVMGEYRAFWQMLEERRAKAMSAAPAPRPAVQMPPGRLFSTYPTEPLTQSTEVTLRKEGPDLRQLVTHPLCGGAALGPEVLRAVASSLAESGPAGADRLAGATGRPLGQVLEAAAVLLKWGVVRMVGKTRG